MKKEDLIIKWLDNNLNEEELRAFKKLDASSAFMKIDEVAQNYAAPSFDQDGVFAKINEEKNRIQKTPWTRYVSGIAAALVVSLGLYFALFNTTPNTTHIAENANHVEFVLPDASEVLLNAGSQIVYNEEDWSSKRELTLNGEAFFKVATGTTFTVATQHGDVTVLGTQFTVNARENYFEVVCYEGVVAVKTNKETLNLSAGNSYKSYNGQNFNGTVTQSQPSWVDAKTIFKSVPYFAAVNELERQYDIKVTFDPDLENTLFTGSFTHENLETALEAITIPLNLSYDMKGKNVVLKSN